MRQQQIDQLLGFCVQYNTLKIMTTLPLNITSNSKVQKKNIHVKNSKFQQPINLTKKKTTKSKFEKHKRTKVQPEQIIRKSNFTYAQNEKQSENSNDEQEHNLNYFLSHLSGTNLKHERQKNSNFNPSKYQKPTEQIYYSPYQQIKNTSPYQGNTANIYDIPQFSAKIKRFQFQEPKSSMTQRSKYSNNHNSYQNKQKTTDKTYLNKLTSEMNRFQSESLSFATAKNKPSPINYEQIRVQNASKYQQSNRNSYQYPEQVKNNFNFSYSPVRRQTGLTSTYSCANLNYSPSESASRVLKSPSKSKEKRKNAERPFNQPNRMVKKVIRIEERAINERRETQLYEDNFEQKERNFETKAQQIVEKQKPEDYGSRRTRETDISVRPTNSVIKSNQKTSSYPEMDDDLGSYLKIVSESRRESTPIEINTTKFTR